MSTLQSGMRRSGLIVGSSVVGVLLTALYIIKEAQLTVDLAYFLPPPTSTAERILVERLGQGPGSRLMFVVLPAEFDVSRDLSRLREQLESSGFFERSSGDLASSGAEVPAALWESRLLLSDIDLSVAGLRKTIRQRLADLAVLNDPRVIEMIAADPTMSALSVVESFDSGADESGPDVTAPALIVETIAPAFEGNAQQVAVNFVRQQVVELAGTPPELFGAGVYTAELQEKVQTDAQLRSLLATLAIAAVIAFAYRDWRAIVLSLAPVLVGALVGAACLVTVYPRIHGITLAFGFTLLGVAIDYPLHYLSHCRRSSGRVAMAEVWPTVQLGALTTASAYVCLMLGGSDGLAQLGLFSSMAVLAALLATRWLLPEFSTLLRFEAAQRAAGPGFMRAPRNMLWLAVLLVAVAFLIARGGPAWQSDLSALVPVEQSRLVRDAALRQQLGAPDIRYLVAVSGPDRETVLRDTEALESTLDQAREAGLIEGATLVTALVPSMKRQQSRVAKLGAVADLDTRLSKAVEETPFRPDVFKPFVQAVDQVIANPEFVNADTWRDSLFAPLVDSGIIEDNGRWVTQSSLYGVSDPAALQALLREAGGGTLIDLRAASESLVAGYRQRMLWVLAVGAVAAFGLLTWRLGAGPRLIWVVGSVTAALLFTVAVRVFFGGSLSLFGLIACILVTGLSLDYGLFSSRDENSAVTAASTRHAVAVCAASTFLAFLILAFSPIPVLTEIGSTVAIGVAASWLLTRFGKVG